VAGAGAASGLVPVVNAEALLTAATAGNPDLWLAIAASVTVGQCAAKVLIYVAAREGPQRLRPDGRVGQLLARVRSHAGNRVRTRRSETPGATTLKAKLQPRRLAELLGRPVPGTSVVLLSAAVGVPPLAAVSVLAGTARLRLPLFVGACLVGRLARFAAIAWPVAHLIR
jgi:membrane protein YqaA with SNARE-associated domain